MIDHGGHGHVRPRPDGAKARCGGPAICPQCAAEEGRIFKRMEVVLDEAAKEMGPPFGFRPPVTDSAPRLFLLQYLGPKLRGPHTIALLASSESDARALASTYYEGGHGFLDEYQCFEAPAGWRGVALTGGAMHRGNTPILPFGGPDR